ncbi:MAG: hypothetical protein AB8G95_31130 [Anaerolineae bacterium]
MFRNLLHPLIYPFRKRQILRRWRASGRPAPPPAYYKHDLLKRVAAENPHLTTFVETGTWRADTLYQLRNHFTQLHSVELDADLYIAAQKRLYRFKQITLWRGHSPEILHRLVPNLAQPTLFWLDAHYMGGPRTGHGVCPVLAELSAICTYLDESAGHQILIDDARNFMQKGDYPTINEVTEHIAGYWPSYRLTMRDDILFYANQSH